MKKSGRVSTKRVAFVSASLMALVAVTAAHAQAQDAKANTPPAQAAQADKPAEIVVTGKRAEVSDKIDRRTYDIKNDPEAQTGFAADVLNKLPSVQVNSSGKVSLRGDSNVIVLVDGKPPATGSQVVQVISATDIDRVEVMTNPSAQYAPDGTAGIINIITKRRHPKSWTGNLNDRFTTQGQISFGASNVVTIGSWTLDNRFGYIHTPTSNRTELVQTLPYAATGHGKARTTWDNLNFPTSIAYKLTDTSSLTLSAQNWGRRSKTAIDGQYNSTVQNYDFTEATSFNYRGNGIDATYDFTNDKTNTHVTLDATHFGFNFRQADSTTNSYAGGGETIYGLHQSYAVLSDQIKGDYEKRLASGNPLTAGFIWSRDTYDSDKIYSDKGTVSGPVADGFQHAFNIDQTIAGAYVTYQMTWGKWTVLPGSRIEWEHHAAQSEGLSSTDGTVALYPSLHLSHDLGEHSKFKLSYSRRVDRPDPTQYDPGAKSITTTAIEIGNPHLKPTDIDSYEAEYNFSKAGANYETAFYYHAKHNLQSYYSYVRSDNIIVSQPINAGESHASGVELTFRSPLPQHWKYALNANLSDSETPLTTGGTRNFFGFNGNGQIEYDAPDHGGKGGDQYQLVFNVTGRNYNIQGYTERTYSVNAVWQHPLSSKISLVVTASNLLETQKTVVVTDTPGLKKREINFPNDQMLIIAMAYKFGAGAKK